MPSGPRLPLFQVVSLIIFFCLFTLTFFTPSNSLENLPIQVRVQRPKTVHVPKPYNDTKLALLIENRVQPHLTPLLLHFMSVVPPDWPFKLLGSAETIAHVNKSAPIRDYVRLGKLRMELLNETFVTNTQEELSQTMTKLEFYESLGPAEFLFVFQTDSIICANHARSLNDWLDYSWVGASWGADMKYGGNGGLSFRRVSHLKQVLKEQKRFDGESLEDWWLTDRLAHMPGSRMANGTEEMEFSVEKVWYDRPLGYHTGHRGTVLMASVWKEKAHRDQIWEYCPEIKLILPMVLARECDCDKDPAYTN